MGEEGVSVQLHVLGARKGSTAAHGCPVSDRACRCWQSCSTGPHHINFYHEGSSNSSFCSYSIFQECPRDRKCASPRAVLVLGA